MEALGPRVAEPPTTEPGDGPVRQRVPVAVEADRAGLGPAGFHSAQDQGGD
jgi:hypothetical protein